MNKNEFYELIDRLKLIPYNTQDSRKYYHNIIITHLNEAPIQHKINVNSYFLESQFIDRLKFIESIKYIDAVELLGEKRIIFVNKEFGNFIFYIDTKFKNKKI